MSPNKHGLVYLRSFEIAEGLFSRVGNEEPSLERGLGGWGSPKKKISKQTTERGMTTIGSTVEKSSGTEKEQDDDPSKRGDKTTIIYHKKRRLKKEAKRTRRQPPLTENSSIENDSTTTSIENLVSCGETRLISKARKIMETKTQAKSTKNGSSSL